MIHGSSGAGRSSGSALEPMRMSEIAGQADGQDVGELFEYSFPAAVTVRKNESAMFPFLQQKLTI